MHRVPAAGQWRHHRPVQRDQPAERPAALCQAVPRAGVGDARADHALLREVGDRYGKTPAQVALRWLIEKDTVLPIPGAKNREQATNNAAALTFRLTQDEIDALDTATRGKHLTPGV